MEPLELSVILDAALDVFQEHGFHGATVREIARRVGMTVPALYYHHENKESLLAALLELGAEEAAWRVRAAADEAAGRRDLQFANVIEAIVLYVTCRTRLAIIDAELRYLSPRARRRYAARRKVVENVLTEVIEAGSAEGVFTVSDPAETSRALLGMCQSIARWYRPGDRLKPADVASRYVDIALQTVGAQPS
ncbi:TetR/AcrR family transcriptional regulator [Amycolatopsis japonica]